MGIRNQHGFTMIELIIVIVILAVLSVITLPMLDSGFNAYFTQRNLSDANWQGRLALSRMLSDIRSIPSTGNITTASATQFTFVDSTNASVSYTLSGTTLQRNGLTLANGVNSIAFSYYNSAGAATAVIANIRYISIQLNVTQNNTNLTMQTALDLRNIIP
ncbi:MAG: prepilin-type N-terminal cleavage/methylation domain-containing protein [Gammaproteobacteria bacterium]|nr:prepilin-type N-terminal cleavage/methylation domain-containing protein [Gammaproteobacteria bacterium]